jgi:histidyl-tRNA synthetase
MSKQQISNQPVKGMADWLPEELNIRQYIFSRWRKICEQYGFEEYLTPILENAEIYRAKSGEDIGNKELMVFVDQGGRELAIRPEMTPSVTRLVSRIYDAVPKPIKFFSIANFVRNERPQRGRNREFWQLNCDIFGSEGKNSELEILSLTLDLVLAFNPPKNSFSLNLNDRRLIDGLLNTLEISSEQKISVVRLMDKYNKMSGDDFEKNLLDLNLSSEQIKTMVKFMTAGSLEDLAKRIPELKDNAGLLDLREIMMALSDLGYEKYLEFKPSVIRGFDYYDGLIFEVFDKHEDNNRAMFGGGRYNALAELFGDKKIPAVGFAPGDETFKLFLESWGMLEDINTKKGEIYFLPLLDKKFIVINMKLAEDLRREGNIVELGLEETKIGKALEYANKKKIQYVVILGEDELKDRRYKIKDMDSGKEKKKRI